MDTALINCNNWPTMGTESKDRLFTLNVEQNSLIQEVDHAFSAYNQPMYVAEDLVGHKICTAVIEENGVRDRFIDA